LSTAQELYAIQNRQSINIVVCRQNDTTYQIDASDVFMEDCEREDRLHISPIYEYVNRIEIELCLKTNTALSSLDHSLQRL
jgi:hypothetical protein